MKTVPLRPWHWRIGFCACAAAILYLALSPLPEKEILTGWDKSNHVAAFGVLTGLGAMAWPARGGRVLCAVLAYGVLIEGLQSLTPDRQPAALDVLADALGVLLGWATLKLARRWL